MKIKLHENNEVVDALLDETHETACYFNPETNDFNTITRDNFDVLGESEEPTTKETIDQLVNDICDEYGGAFHLENEMREKLKKSITFLILYGYQKGFDKCLDEYAIKLSLAKEALEDIAHNIYSNEFSPEMIEKKAREALVKIT